MRIYFILLLLGVIAFSGCNGANTNSNKPDNVNGNSNTPIFVKPEIIAPKAPPDPNFKSCNPAFPLVPGSQAEFLLQFTSGLIADVRVVVEKGEENGQPIFIETTQIIDKSGGLYKNELTKRKYTCDNGRILLFSEKIDNKTEKGSSLMDLVFRDVAVLMPDPASLGRKGTTWSYSFTPIASMPGVPRIEAETSTINFEVMGEEPVKVAAGEFNAIKIQRKIKDKVIFDYFVPGIGLVKRTSNEGGTWDLKAFSGLKEVK